MRKITQLIVAPILLILLGFSGSYLEHIRSNYNKLVSNKELCRKMIVDLEKNKSNSNTYLAYLGGSQTIWANHVVNPFSKLSTFKEGRKNIDLAIKNDPKNVELRYIRLSVQKNAPGFLGYKSNIKEDTEIIKQLRHKINSRILQKNIDGILKNL